MNRFVPVTLLISFLWFSVAFPVVSNQEQQQSTTIAILPFDAKGGISKPGAVTLSDRLRGELVNLKVYTVLERGEMQAILTEQGFNLSGCTTSECAVEAGRLLGVQHMMAGDVGKVGNILTIDVRVFNVETGEILQAHQFDYEGDATGLLLLMKNIARRVAGLEEETGFPWLWVSLGAVALGGTAAILLLNQKDDASPASLPNPEWPPQ